MHRRAGSWTSLLWYYHQISSLVMKVDDREPLQCFISWRLNGVFFYPVRGCGNTHWWIIDHISNNSECRLIKQFSVVLLTTRSVHHMTERGSAATRFSRGLLHPLKAAAVQLHLDLRLCPLRPVKDQIIYYSLKCEDLDLKKDAFGFKTWWFLLLPPSFDPAQIPEHLPVISTLINKNGWLRCALTDRSRPKSCRLGAVFVATNSEWKQVCSC